MINILDGTFVGPWGIRADYGWFHVYAFTMFLGITVSILVSWYKLYKHKIPTDSLIWSVIFIIPASLFGASFIGKDDHSRPMGFWQKFAFWEEGLSIHGGVLFGVIMGLFVFAFVSRKNKVSLWVYGDCIIPNILLGQVIGRWGNFFNHELLGQIVGYSETLNASNIPALAWLPAFIRDNCFEWTRNGGIEQEIINGRLMYVFRAPIFLYESLANLGFWAFLTFLLPKTFFWVSKKPWKVLPHKYQLLTIKDINSKKGKNNKLKNYWVLVYRNMILKRKYWKQAFYDYHADSFIVKNLNQKYRIIKNQTLVHNTTGFWSKLKYQIFVKNYLISKAYFNISKKLYHLNNPQNYTVMRSGVQMWLYFFGWNLIRFGLEIQRRDADLFIINRRALDYTILISTFVLGLILAILSQLVFARYFRTSSWTYEKEY